MRHGLKNNTASRQKEKFETFDDLVKNSQMLAKIKKEIIYIGIDSEIEYREDLWKLMIK